MNSSKEKYDKEINIFLSLLTDIDDEEDIRKRIRLKGLFSHNYILNFLKENNIEIKYSYIQSIRIYDKRIRLILFKYISMVEEHLRSILESEGLLRKIDKNRKNSKSNSFNYQEISNGCYYFADILDAYLNFAKKSKLKFKSIKKLRNDIFHNKIIVLKFENIKPILLVKDLLIDDEIANQYIIDLRHQLSKISKKNNIKIELPQYLIDNFCNKIK